MPIIFAPKALRDKLGEEASEFLITILEKTNEDQKIHLFTVLEDRFEKRLTETISGLHSGFHGMNKSLRTEMHTGFLNMQKQIADIHKTIAAQTKWFLAAILAGITIHPVAAKIIDRLL